MKKNNIIIALFGQSGSGKDTGVRLLTSKFKSLHRIIPTTTRPMRDTETKNVDYYFVDKEQFTKGVLNNNFYTVNCYNNWFYGINKNEIEDNPINIGAFSIKDIKQLLNFDNLTVIPIYIKASDKTRLIRCLTREDNPDCKEICRRFIADNEDFQNIGFNFDIVENENIELFNHNLDILVKSYLDIYKIKME